MLSVLSALKKEPTLARIFSKDSIANLVDVLWGGKINIMNIIEVREKHTVETLKPFLHDRDAFVLDGT